MIYAYITHRLLGWKWAFVRFHSFETGKKERQLCRILITAKPNGRRQVWAKINALGPWGEWVQIDDWANIVLVYPTHTDLLRVKASKGR